MILLSIFGTLKVPAFALYPRQDCFDSILATAQLKTNNVPTYHAHGDTYTAMIIVPVAIKSLPCSQSECLQDTLEEQWSQFLRKLPSSDALVAVLI